MLFTKTVFLCVVFAMLMPRLGFARSNEAKAAFNEGTLLFNQKKFPEAAVAFRRAYELKPTWRLLYNIGQAEAATKRYGLALESFERYLSEGGDEVEIERRNEVLEEIRKLRDMVGDIKISGPDGAVVIVDGVKRGKLPLAFTVPVSAGTEHQLEVLEGDTVLLRKTARVRSAKTLHIDASHADDDLPQEMASDTTIDAADVSAETVSDLQSEPGQPVQEKSNATQPPLRLFKTGIILLGVGGASLVGGLITGIMAVKKKDELESACDGDICYGGDTRSIEDARHHLALTTDILLIAGGVLVTTGGILLAVALKKKKTSQLSVRHFFAPGLAGIVMGGRF